LIALVPLLWLVAVTFTAGLEKVFSDDPKIGFLAQARVLDRQMPALTESLAKAEAANSPTAMETARTALQTNRSQQFNQKLDAVVALSFLLLVVAIVALSGREWVQLMGRRHPARLHENPPVWLPEFAATTDSRSGSLPALALLVALARELSGEAAMDRAQAQPAIAMNANVPLVLPEGNPREGHSGACHCLEAPLRARPTREQAYVAVAERRFRSGSRCC
jgi:carbon starvation protein